MGWFTSTNKIQRRRPRGPYEITEAASLILYRLDLPLAWKIDLGLHASNLKSYHPTAEFIQVERPSSLMVVEWKEEYESESILQHKGEGASLRPFLLHKGFSIIGASWEPVSSLEDALVILEE